MRTIYAIQLRPLNPGGKPSSSCFNDLVTKTCRWVEEKCKRAWGTVITVPDDGSVLTPLEDHSIRGVRRAVGDVELFELEWFHPPDDLDPSITWATTCLIARNGQDLQFALLVRISSKRAVLRPVRYDLGRPRIISEILETYPTAIDDWPVPLDLKRLTPPDVEAYVNDVLLNASRNLPVVMVSPDVWRGDYAVNAEQLLQALKGYAHVCVLADKWAAFKLTDTLSKDLSCYNGSVRIYWPAMARTDSPFKHKLYFPRSIEFHEARGLPFERHLFRMLSAIASFRFTEGKVIRTVRLVLTKAESARLEGLRQQLEAGEIAKDELENQLLEALDTIDVLTKERDRLREDVEAQKAAWGDYQNFMSDEQEEDESAAATEQSKIESVRDAVAHAQEQFGDTLLFLESAVKLAAESPFQNPDQVYGLFETLGELVQEWRDHGCMGASWKAVLGARGIDYKGDISPTCKQKKNIGDYEFLYEGKKRIFGEHVTFGKGQDPQKCLSVHWWRDENKKLPVIGRCGKHGANTKA